MTDESQVWGSPQGTPPPAAPIPAGWYPDPWSRGHHRYWDGSAWTGGSFPHGPATTWPDEGTDAVTGPLPPPPAAHDQSSPPPPPAWSPPSPNPAWAPAPSPYASNTAEIPAETASKPSRLWSGVGFVALVVAVVLVVGSLGTLGGYLAFRHRSTSGSSAAGPPPTLAPSGPTSTLPPDPSASVLQSLVVQQADVPSDVVVQPIPGGDQVSGEPTLDLCNGTYPSEAQRSARLQVAAYNALAMPLLSTEAVLYRNPAAADQAFAELKSVAAGCPSTPVISPVGEDTVTTQFSSAPDVTWAQTPGVTRMAFDFVVDDADTGSSQHSVAVYLHRGRAFIGVYFSQPDSSQVTVAGQSTIESIAAVFAGRLASLPASVVNG